MHILVLFLFCFVFLIEVCAYLSSEPFNSSAHNAHARYSSLAKLAALYVVQISNEQLHFIKSFDRTA